MARHRDRFGLLRHRSGERIRRENQSRPWVNGLTKRKYRRGYRGNDNRDANAVGWFRRGDKVIRRCDGYRPYRYAAVQTCYRGGVAEYADIFEWRIGRWGNLDFGYQHDP